MRQDHNDAAMTELRELLRAVLVRDVPKLADLRRIEQLRRRIEHQDDPGFFPIRAAVSDLDTAPDESHRELFSEQFLKKQDEECVAYLEAARNDLRKGASALLDSSWLAVS